MLKIAVRRILLVFTALILTALPAVAHEFWLEPADFTPRRAENVPISIFIGQKFKGNSYPFIRQEFRKFVVIDARGEKPVKGVDGDDPALSTKFSEPGLVIFAHYSTPEKLEFDTWEKFLAYLEFEGLEHIAKLHLQQGKPQTGIKEIYSRCAKLLMSVGGGGGEDRLTGMPLELVAERNPYSLKPGEALSVRLYFEGKPVPDVMISAISKADPENRMRVRTDKEGRARLALPAPGPWLLNSVHMIPPARSDDTHWSSLWASMTFARP
jgi:hypothetical protein